MKNVGVILAGGSGNRLNLQMPKQFLKIAGKTIIEHSINVFEQHNQIDEIAVVMHPMFYTNMESMIAKNRWKKVKKILYGGKERYESSLSAIKAYENEGDSVNLIFHDSVRPLVSARIITDVCNSLQYNSAVDVVVPAVDTIVQLDDQSNYIKTIPNRDYLRRGQTPQGFHWNTIKAAYDIALKDSDFKATDDCGIVVKYLPNVKVAIVKGEESNIKLTNPEDIYLIDKLFQLKSTSPIQHALEKFNKKVLVIFGGNSGIGADMASIAKKTVQKFLFFLGVKEVLIFQILIK